MSNNLKAVLFTSTTRVARFKNVYTSGSPTTFTGAMNLQRIPRFQSEKNLTNMNMPKNYAKISREYYVSDLF
jgi:hypothetical protein